MFRERVICPRCGGYREHNIRTGEVANCDDCNYPGPDEQEINMLRRLLWLRHGCSGPALYGDDGRMDCNACLIDFQHNTPEEIETRFQMLAQAALKG